MLDSVVLFEGEPARAEQRREQRRSPRPKGRGDSADSGQLNIALASSQKEEQFKVSEDIVVERVTQEYLQHMILSEHAGTSLQNSAPFGNCLIECAVHYIDGEVNDKTLNQYRSLICDKGLERELGENQAKIIEFERQLNSQTRGPQAATRIRMSIEALRGDIPFIRSHFDEMRRSGVVTGERELQALSNLINATVEVGSTQNTTLLSFVSRLKLFCS